MPQVKRKEERYSNFLGINSKVSLYLTNQNEVLNIENLDFFNPGALSNVPGTTLFTGLTVSGRITGLYEYEKLNGFSQLIFGANTNLYQTTVGSSATSIKSGLTNDNLFDFETFVDLLFISNGAEFLKYNGTTASFYSAPQAEQGSSIFVRIGSFPILDGTGLEAGDYLFKYGFLTNSGYLSFPSEGVTLTIIGQSIGLGQQYAGFTYPADYGITAFAFYMSRTDGTEVFFSHYEDLSATFTLFYNMESGLGELAPTSPFFTLAPRYLEVYENSLFAIGFSTNGSLVAYSETGEPENIQPEYNFEYRTNDGDFITGAKQYRNSLYLFKRYAFCKVIGNNPSNFERVDVFNEYGAINNNSIVIADDIMLFLNEKGVAQFTGTKPQIISDKIEELFLNMDVDAARDNATAVLDRDRNQVKFSFPSLGATMNDTHIFYDYTLDSWGTETGLDNSILSLAVQDRGRKTPFFGTYDGQIGYHTASLFTNVGGVGQTYVMQSKFFAPEGKSRTMQFRRLYLDSDPISGFTVPVTVNFRVNQQDSIVLSRTMYMNEFQSRIDFGIPAKSLSVEFIVSGASYPIKINGFTVEYREQRRT